MLFSKLIELFVCFRVPHLCAASTRDVVPRRHGSLTWTVFSTGSSMAIRTRKPSGSASEGIQNTRPTLSMGNSPGTASPLQQIFGGNSSQPPSMGSFQAGSLGFSDGLFSGLLNEDYLTRKVDNSFRRLKRETRMMNEPPFPYFLDPFGKLFK